MAVVFSQLVPFISGVSTPLSSASFTPAGAVVVWGMSFNNGQVASSTLLGAGPYTALIPSFADVFANNWAFATFPSAPPAPQVVTISNAGTSVYAQLEAAVYSGADVYNVSGSKREISNPGGGAGAILGNPVTVPVGGVLLSVCQDANFPITPPSAVGGTVRDSNASFAYVVAEYAGTGGVITPTFTAGATFGADDFVVLQALLLPQVRVQAVKGGWYNGAYYQVGDVFDLLLPSDFSDASVNYAGSNAGVQQFGWMTMVPLTTPLFQAQTVQVPAPLFPVADTTPPITYVY